MLPGARPVLRHVVTALCVVGVLLPAAAGAAPDPERELDEVNERLDRARYELDRVRQRKRVELADLQRIDARRAALDAELATLTTELAGAQQVLSRADQALAATTQRLQRTEDRLRTTRRRLDVRRERFADRARASYMFGGQAAFSALAMDVDSLDDFSRGVKYARAVLSYDHQQVELVAGLEREVQRAVADLDVLRAEQRRQEKVATAERDRVAGIVAEREEVAAQVAAEADKHRLVIAQLESDRRSYLAMVDTLQSESATLEEQLRRRAEEERRRAVAAAARAARQAADAASPSAQKGSAGGGATADSGQGMLWPASGRLTSGFGWRTHPIFGTRRLHAGIDIGAGYGAKIMSAEAGTVVSAGSMTGYGNVVVIDHGGGISTLYAHQASVAVSGGQSVQRGQTIGYVGSTGYSTGPHLHFEVRVNGAPVDPMGYL